MAELLYWRGVPVPYITTWSAETRNPVGATLHMVANGASTLVRVSYEDETPYDRDAHGALWQRYPMARGKGEPLFARVHPARQRRCMTRRLCQVCAQPADQNDQGWLWLVTAADALRLKTEGTGEVRTSNPPVCHPCSQLARTYCPNLLGGNALVRVPALTDWGVYGIETTPTDRTPGIDRAYSHPAIGQMVAGQQIVVLHNVTTLELELP